MYLACSYIIADWISITLKVANKSLQICLKTNTVTNPCKSNIMLA